MTSNETSEEKALVSVLGLRSLSSDEAILSNETLKIFQFTNYTFILMIIGVFGMAANVINGVVFLKIGFKDSINISLFGLSISDFFGCLTMVAMNVFLVPWFQDLDLPFDPFQMHYLTAAWPHVIFARITGVLTAFVTFERCLCVTIPLKIKNVMTTKTVAYSVVVIYVLTTASFIPIYLITGYTQVFFPQINKTLIVLSVVPNRLEVELVFLPYISFVLPVLTFIAVIICTSLLISTLKKKTEWRQSSSVNASKTSDMSSKEKKTSTMLIIIAFFFVISFIPIMFLAVICVVDPEITFPGKRWRLMHVIFSFSLLFEAINSSVNIFVYHNKNTNYRNMFDKLFHRKESSAN